MDSAERAARRFDHRLGQRLERLRTGREPGYRLVDRQTITQEEVAARARRLGLEGWTRSTVAATERGGRSLFPAELALLPYVLTGLGVARADVRKDGAVDLKDLTLSDLLHQDDVVAWHDQEQQRRDRRPLPPVMRRWAERVVRRAQGLDLLPEGLSVESALVLISDRREDLQAWAREDAVVKAVSNNLDLAVPPIALALAALVTWGHGLTEEREERLKRPTMPGRPAREMQAARGHVTRQLIEELSPLIAGAKTRSRKRGYRR